MKFIYTILASLLFNLSLHAQIQTERIIRFHSDIVIDTTGRIEVTEDIKFYVAGINIKRGIERDIPLYRKDVYGRRVRMETNIISVHCNGNNATCTTSETGDNTILRIGDPDVLLNEGEYEYAIVYESFGHVGFFDEYDELYWNVTGNGWVFPIEQASATITLPAGVNVIAGQTSCYTGAAGSTAQDCSVEDRGNSQFFTTNKSLAPFEGLTVAVAFPRDIVSRPPPPTPAWLFWYTYKYHVCGLIGLLLFAIYWFFSILKIGKQPIKPVVIPTFNPPRDMSPAEIGYVRSKSYSNQVMTATFIDMAVKGSMTISCEEKKKKKKKYSFVKKEDTSRLRPVEQRLHNTLFSGEKELVEVAQGNYQRFSQANTNLQKSLESNWNIKDYFRENKGYAIGGGLLAGVIIVLYSVFTMSNLDVLIAFCFAAPFIGAAAIYMLTFSKADIGCGVISLFMFVPVVLFIAALWGEIESSIDQQTHWLSAAFYAILPVAYIVYASRLDRNTPKGAEISSEIEGFRMYMKTAEENRLNMLTTPEHTLELFEALLPYAIVLGVSNEWSKKFNDVLTRIDYHPDWYDSKDNLREIGFATAIAGLSTSFGTSVQSANTDPTSSSSSSGSSDWSSGSSGGGYSGGGGGGGGGRGW
ncbi:MAG: DUF2207 domain-containing protein [Tannerella sp.]|nr:DUF2207 domain-containing protein [Tannerella sp.]